MTSSLMGKDQVFAEMADHAAVSALLGWKAEAVKDAKFEFKQLLSLRRLAFTATKLVLLFRTPFGGVRTVVASTGGELPMVGHVLHVHGDRRVLGAGAAVAGARPGAAGRPVGVTGDRVLEAVDDEVGARRLTAERVRVRHHRPRGEPRSVTPFGLFTNLLRTILSSRCTRLEAVMRERSVPLVRIAEMKPDEMAVAAIAKMTIENMSSMSVMPSERSARSRRRPPVYRRPPFGRTESPIPRITIPCG